MSKKIILQRIFVGLILICASAIGTFAQGTGFNFQGRLNDGTNPANGSYDLQFRLYNAATGGIQIGTTTALRPNTTLINGVFSVTLDFGATAFNNPNLVFIEIGIRPNGSPNAYTILGPRQQLTVVPFAVRAANATNADIATNAQNAINSQNATTAANAIQLNGVAASEYVTKTNGGTDFIRNSTTIQQAANFNIAGNGVINGNLNVAGNNVSGGNVSQNRDKGGLVKAMVYVTADGTILRCYNGITGASTGNCGFTSVNNPVLEGSYSIDFGIGFQVTDRFVSITPQTASSVNIGATFSFTASQPQMLFIRTVITDVDWINSFADNPFMVIVY